MARILVLEDDKLFNETLEDFLEEEGHTIQCALDPYTALDLAYEYVFDLYLFDVNLPYENGFELLEKNYVKVEMKRHVYLSRQEMIRHH